MMGVIEFWMGKKTKTLGLLLVLTGVALTISIISAKTAFALALIFGGTAIATLREAIATESADVSTAVGTTQAQIAHVDAKVTTNEPVVAKVAEHVKDIKAAVENPKDHFSNTTYGAP